MRKYKLLNEVIDNIEWCPNRYAAVAVTNDTSVYIIQTGLAPRVKVSETATAIDECERGYNIDAKASDDKEKNCK